SPKIATFSPRVTASAMRVAATSMSVKVCGSGIRRRMLGSRKASASSGSTPRPAMTRASNSGRPRRCAIVSARAWPRASRRSRQIRPVADFSTPRNASTSILGSGSAVMTYPTRAMWSANQRLARVASARGGRLLGVTVLLQGRLHLGVEVVLKCLHARRHLLAELGHHGGHGAERLLPDRRLVEGEHCAQLLDREVARIDGWRVRHHLFGEVRQRGLELAAQFGERRGVDLGPEL